MAKAKKTGKDGIDRWTSNGKGLVFGKPVITKKQADAMNAEAGKKRGKK